MSFTVYLGNLPAWVTADDIKSWLVEEDLAALSYGRHSVSVSVPADGIATVRCRGSLRSAPVTQFARY